MLAVVFFVLADELSVGRTPLRIDVATWAHRCRPGIVDVRVRREDREPVGAARLVQRTAVFLLSADCFALGHHVRCVLSYTSYFMLTLFTSNVISCQDEKTPSDFHEQFYNLLQTMS